MKYTASILLILALCSCYGKKPKIKTGLEGKPMPSIELLAADSNKLYNTANIKPGKPTLLFFFETWCPYCKAQTESLLSHASSLNDINIYMVCNTGFPNFRKFYEDHHLNRYPTIKAGVDRDFQFQHYFRMSDVPCLAIYDKEKNLKQVLLGKTSISTIEKIAFE